MLTIDDCNTIMEKYGRSGFWYEVDVTKFPSTVGDIITYDFMKIKNNDTAYLIKMDNHFFSGLNYCTNNGQITSNILLTYFGSGYDYGLEMSPQVDKLYLFLTADVSIYGEYQSYANQPLIIPKNGVQIPIINGEYDDKFYFNLIRGSVTRYTINGEEVEVETDEQGTFLRLPSANDCVIIAHYLRNDFPQYKVVFNEFKSIPQLSVSTLYRGTPQTIQLINNDTEEPITEFQAYYQGRKLKDNIIELPYDAPDVVDITVDLLDPKYPESTVKLKANTEIKLCKGSSTFKQAVEQGIQTIQLFSSSIGVTTIADMELKDITIINSRISFRDCIFNNVNFIETEKVGAIRLSKRNILNNCNLQDLTNLQVSANTSVMNNCTLRNIDSIRTYPTGTNQIQITGSITDCNIDNLIIISDGDLTLTNNSFSSKTTKAHFPNFLYLTGEYTVTNNTFNLTGEWEELAFNMCIIKANNDFNPSSFISNNTFNLNIAYEGEPTNTFYYCLVDDDKIKAVRLQ